ncbi:MAG: hypothetical protein ACLQGU_02575 [bacterium]
MDIIQCLRHEELFAKLFPDLESWQRWIVCLKAIYGLEMTPAELEIFKFHTGRERPPAHQVSEGYLIDGRGSGKSRIGGGVIVPFHSVFMPYQPSPGERLHSLLLSVNRWQSRICNRYCNSTFSSIPLLGDFVSRSTMSELDLKNGVSIEIATSSFRSLRGYSICLAILDECAFFRDEESANPDVEIINSLRPGLGRVPGSLLLCISSPYGKKGILYSAFRNYYGVESDDVLVWVSDTLSMNPLFDRKTIDRAFELDPSLALSEYGTDGKVTFRSDLESFIDREIAESCIMPGCHELPYSSEHTYHGFCDPSGGSSDSMTLGISHAEGNMVKLDLIRERVPPFSPEAVVEEFCEVLKSYKITKVTGDKYAGEWPRERFRIRGISYEIAEKTKSELYLSFLPLLNSKRVELLDDRKLLTQLCNLERRTGHGKDVIDHPVNSHDDVINAVAGSVIACQVSEPGLITYYRQLHEKEMARVKEIKDLSRIYTNPTKVEEEKIEEDRRKLLGSYRK